jgi:predicted Ser/Thr protein kinase
LATEGSLTCGCGERIPVQPGDGKSSVTCPKCALVHPLPPPKLEPAKAEPATLEAATSEPGKDTVDTGIEHLLLKKGWVTPEQIKTAHDKKAEHAKAGKSIRIGEALIELGMLKPEQVREALAEQGKVPMRCPNCKKTYNVKGLRAGTRAVCKACRTVLVAPETLTDVHAEDTGTSIQHVLAGEAVDPAVVDMVPGYRIERCLGTGGMGVVYLARQKSLDRLVALKVLSKQLAADAAYVKRFMAEARSAAKLRHENIVAAVDSGESAGSYYFVMEYIEGETLESTIRRDGALPERRALEIARQVACGLQHASAQGLIHRDIKPANVMITTTGVAKICDFGLARDVHSDVTLTQAGMVHSSPAYASPEQCKALPTLDHRADMYSLGIVLFEMLTGQRPFKGETPSALFVLQVTQAAPSPKTINSAITAAANALVLRLLRKEPERRFKNYEELLASIDEVRQGPKATAPTSTRRSMVVPSKQSKTPWIAAAAVLAVLAVAAIWMISGKKPDPSTAGAGGEVGGEAGKALREAKAFEKAAQGRPAEYAAVRARWKDLVEKYRGTPHHNLFAGPLVEFEARITEESEKLADRFVSEARSQQESGQVADAVATLRGFPAGFQDTSGAGRVASKASELETLLARQFEAGREEVATLVTTGKFNEANSKVAAIRAQVSYQGANGTEYLKPAYKEELDAMGRRVEEEALMARRREAEARQKDEAARRPTPPPVPVPQPNPDPVAPKPRVEIKPPAPVPPAPTAQRTAVPDLNAQKDAEKLIREIYKADYGRTAPSDKSLLAKKLLKLAVETKDDPTGKFVLLREARDLAAAGGDEPTVTQAIDELVREYQVDARAMRESTLLVIGQAARTPEEMRSFVQLALKCADDALAVDDFEGAAKLAGSAAATARRLKDLALVTKADAKSRECEDWKARGAQYLKAKELLAKNPQNAEAAATVGQFLCFVKGSWAEGLEFLAKGTAGPAKDLAVKEAAPPSDGPGQISIGDGWWTLAEKETGPTRANLRRRAAYWYGMAVPQAVGLERLRLEKRIQEADPAGAPIDLLKLMTSRDSIGPEWTQSGNAFLSPDGTPAKIMVPYAPGDSEYDLTVVVQPRGGSGNFEIGLVHAGRQFLVDLDGSPTSDLSGLLMVDGMAPQNNVTTYRGRVLNRTGSTVVCSVRRSGVSIVVDGRKIIDFQGSYTRLALSPAFRVPNPDSLFLSAFKSQCTVAQLTLRPVSGQGRLLR